MKKTNVIKLTVLIAAAAALCFLLFFFYKKKAEYYETHFFQGTYINGWDVSDETAQDVKDDIQGSISGYQLTIYEKDGASEVITGDEINLLYSDNGEIDKILKDQDANKWLFKMGKTSDYTISSDFTFEESDIRSAVDSLACMQEENVTVSEDAYIDFVSNSFVIVPEVVGNEIDRTGLYEAVKNAVTSLEESINIEELGLYIEPEVTSDNQELIDELDAKNLIFNTEITYDFIDSQFVVNKDNLAGWITADENGEMTVDYSSVYSFVTNMAYETDTFGLSHKFTTSSGVEITLEPGGDYGWCIDKDKTTENLIQYILEGTQAVVEPDYIYTANDRSSNDIGDTYVEVCISTQTVWCYYDGELVVTGPCVTGNVAKGHATPSGSVWAIDGKISDWVFNGYSHYYHSDYWMPFNEGVGLHDASWRSDSSYTATTYLTSGSNGCVNMQHDTAKAIYEHMEIGDPVIVYYSTDKVHGQDSTGTVTGP